MNESGFDDTALAELLGLGSCRKPANSAPKLRWSLGPLSLRCKRRLRGDGAQEPIEVTEAKTGWLRDHSSRIMTAGIILALLYRRAVRADTARARHHAELVGGATGSGAAATRSRQNLFGARCGCGTGGVVHGCCGRARHTNPTHAENLPQYESNVQRKLKTLEE